MQEPTADVLSVYLGRDAILVTLLVVLSPETVGFPMEQVGVGEAPTVPEGEYEWASMKHSISKGTDTFVGVIFIFLILVADPTQPMRSIIEPLSLNLNYDVVVSVNVLSVRRCYRLRIFKILLMFV